MITVQHKVTHYKIITGEPYNVARDVQVALGAGWILYGPPLMDKGYYAQAMVQIEDNWRGE
jgi:hypothetical protein